MTLRWSVPAAHDLEHIHRYISNDNSEAAADSVIERIIEAAERLLTFPESGRPGRVKATRELVRPPYVLVYRVLSNVISIERVLHGSQRR